MSNNNLHVHNVTRVSVESEEIGFDSGNGYTVYRLEIHSDNYRDEDEVIRVTLYGTVGEHYGPGVPFEFSKVEDEAPPPALKLAIERDLDGAVRHGKVFGDFLDSMLSPPKR